MIPRAALLLTSLFEHGKPEVQYKKCENAHDGRGWTCGAFGYTSQDAKSFKFPKEAWKLLSFNTIWGDACKDPEFQKLQLQVAEEEFLTPAVEEMARLHLKHFLTLAVFFDTLVQHGAGADPDGFYAILRGWHPGGDEEKELFHFLSRREHVLLNPKNKTSKKTWAESVDRVRAFRQLLGYRVDEVKLPPNLELRLPIELRTCSYSLVIK